MKRKITVLAVLIFFTISIFAQKQDYTSIEKSENIILINSIEKNTERYPFKRKIVFQKHSNNLKSIETNKQRLDSVVGQNWKDIHWMTNDKKVYTYDSNGNTTQDFVYRWDGTISQWPSYKSEYTYDSSWNITQKIGYNWDETISQWIVDYKTDYTCDSMRNTTRSYSWNKTTNQWEGTDGFDYTYDSNGDVTQNIEYRWEYTSGLWVFNAIQEYTYDSNGNRIQFVSGGWDDGLSQWGFYSKANYTYDASGNLAQIIAYRRDNTGQWVFSYKDECTYDSIRSTRQNIGYVWNETTSQWLIREKSEYTYDANGNLTQLCFYHWSETTGQWLGILKREYNYDLSYKFSDLIVPPLDWLEFQWNDIILNNMPLVYSYYNWDGKSNDWANKSRKIYYYSEQNITANSEINEAEVNVYPNPFSEYISLSMSNNNGQISFELFDMLGRKIMTREIEANEKVSMVGLKKGMYFYNLIIDGKKQMGKLIKE